jgi:hypothetical protein
MSKIRLEAHIVTTDTGETAAEFEHTGDVVDVQTFAGGPETTFVVTTATKVLARKRAAPSLPDRDEDASGASGPDAVDQP